MAEKDNREEQDTQAFQEERSETAAEKESVVDSSELEEKIKKLEHEKEDLADQNLRLHAEIQNIMKRNQRERAQLTKYNAQELATAILPVMDNLDRALAIEATDEAGQSLKEGIEMVRSGFISALDSVGVKPMDCLDEPFDPNYHEAYTMVEPKEGQASGVVAEVFEKGYMIHDRILRAAKVAVTN